MLAEDREPILISAIAHHAYCPRRCALIHVEQIFDENVFTLRGQASHERVDSAGYHHSDSVRVERALPVWCERLGIHGKADAVEFHADGAIVPVEYKSGVRPESRVLQKVFGDTARPDDLQLCAQAVCLEEMFAVSIASGSIYHIASRRRRPVEFTDELRQRLLRIIAEIRACQDTGAMPPPVNDARCPNCSLVEACAPAALVAGRQAFHLRQLYRVEEG